MLENFQGDSWGLIPPLRMLSLLPHDLCHGWSSSRWLPAMIEFQLSYSGSWKMMLWKVLHSICNMHSVCNMPALGNRKLAVFSISLCSMFQECVLVKRVARVLDRHGFKSQLCHLMAQVSWKCNFTTIILSNLYLRKYLSYVMTMKLSVM